MVKVCETNLTNLVLIVINPVSKWYVVTFTPHPPARFYLAGGVTGTAGTQRAYLQYLSRE